MPKTSMPHHEWFDYDTGATYLGVTKRQLQRLVADHKIGHTRLGLRTLFSQGQLDDYVEACTVDPRS
jgi:excisionase family DNA binding protein